MEETNISQILKACRQKAGITQAQFAETIGVKRSAYEHRFCDARTGGRLVYG